MIKVRRLPVFTGVAGRTIIAKAPLMGVVARMTGETFAGSTIELCVRVAGFAGGIRVSAD